MHSIYLDERSILEKKSTRLDAPMPRYEASKLAHLQLQATVSRRPKRLAPNKIDSFVAFFELYRMSIV